MVRFIPGAIRAIARHRTIGHEGKHHSWIRWIQISPIRRTPLVVADIVANNETIIVSILKNKCNGLLQPSKGKGTDHTLASREELCW